MRKNNRAVFVSGIVIIVIIALFAIPRFRDPKPIQVKAWKDDNVNCLPSHTQAVLHIHPKIQIVMDGGKEEIPANIGIVRNCMAEIHTHDASGTIHIESVVSEKTFTLADFFTVWGKSIERPGLSLEMTVGGEPSAEFGSVVLRDNLEIILHYTK